MKGSICTGLIACSDGNVQGSSEPFPPPVSKIDYLKESPPWPQVRNKVTMYCNLDFVKILGYHFHSLNDPKCFTAEVCEVRENKLPQLLAKNMV